MLTRPLLSRTLCVVLLLAGAGAAATVLPAHAGADRPPQQTNTPTLPGPPGTQGPLHGGVLEEPSPMAGSNAARLEHMREDDRRKRLLADTARLVVLSNELKEDVEKTSKDQLSLEVIRKAAELEKLAHDVKERMKS